MAEEFTKYKEKVVFILGAGASFDAGIPLMNNFLDFARSLNYQGLVKDSKESFDAVFEAIGKLQIVHSKSDLDLINLESVFSILEFGEFLEFLPNHEISQISSLVSSFKRVVVRTIEESMPMIQKGDNQVWVPNGSYYNFTNLIRNKKDKYSFKFITFNYDLGLDICFRNNGLTANYGLQGEDSNIPDHIDLYKLHGSLNWAKVVDKDQIIPIDIGHIQANNPSIDGRQSFLRIGGKMGEISEGLSLGFNLEDEPFIVPPTWNKQSYHKILRTVWKKAAKAISEAEYVYIVGYSMPETDQFFRYLYALGSVGANPFTKFMVVDPDGGGNIDRKIRGLLGPGALARYSFENKRFGDAVSENIFF